MKKRQPVTRRSTRSEDDYAVFVALLATVRREQEVTQVELGRRVGRRQTWVAKVEAGDRRIDAIELLAVLDVLKVDVIDFFARLRRELRKSARQR